MRSRGARVPAHRRGFEIEGGCEQAAERKAEQDHWSSGAQAVEFVADSAQPVLEAELGRVTWKRAVAR